MINFFEANIGILFLGLFLTVFLIAFVVTLLLSKKLDKRPNVCKSYLYYEDIKKIRDDEAECEIGNVPLSSKKYDRILLSGIEIRKEDHIKLVNGYYEI